MTTALVDALLKPGIKLAQKKGVPYFFHMDDRPGWMVQELDGQKAIGRFIDGQFVAEEPVSERSAKKRSTKA